MSAARPRRCSRRSRTEAALDARLRDYRQKTDPVLDLFRRKEYVLTVATGRDPLAVAKAIRFELGLPDVAVTLPAGDWAEL